MRTCRDCGDDFSPNDKFMDTTGRRGVFRRHGDVGFVDQCGHCWMADEDNRVERYVALEEPPAGGGKASCEVLPMKASNMGGGMARYVNFSQHHQPIGGKR